MRMMLSVFGFMICLSTLAELETWEIHCDSVLGVYDPHAGDVEPLPRLEAYARSIGYTSPENASLSIDDGNQTITITNTPENIAIIRHVVALLMGYPPVVSLHVELLAIDPELATRWGLDGGEPTAPADCPIEGPLTPVLPAEKASTLMKALRSHEQVMIVQALTSTTRDGVTTVTDAVTDVRFAESFTEEQTVTTGEGATHYPQTEVYGDSEEVGLIVRWTPNVLVPLTRQLVILDVESVFRAYIGNKPSQVAGAKHTTPLFYRSSLEMDVEVQFGDMLLKPAGRVDVPAAFAAHVSFRYPDKYLLWTFTPILHVREQGFAMTQITPEASQ